MNILSPINFHAFFILYTLLIIYRVFYLFIKFINGFRTIILFVIS